MKNEFLFILHQCFTPFTIFSPIPLYCIVLFSISLCPCPILLVLGIFASYISISASNFWNHTNDGEEDGHNSKKTIITENTISHNSAIFISIVLYASSILFFIYLSSILNRPIYIFYIIWAFITWWYSDKMFLKKITHIRLKEHWIGELVTYTIAYPAYTMSIWLIFSDSISKGLILSLVFLCFGISGVLLKDIKDIKGDTEAGLKTFGVIFRPATLLKYSCVFLVFYFLAIFASVIINILNIYSLLVIVPFVFLLKDTILHFQSKKWTIELSDRKNIKSMITSVYFSLIILGIVNFIF